MAFIVFEGLDGSGKSTLIKALDQELESKNISRMITREPGGTPLAEEIRGLLLKIGDEKPVDRCELLLYEASRAQHVDYKIKPALQKGDWVLCDRFYGSTVAFQCFARGLDRESTDWLNNYAVGGTHPDLTILLDLSTDESFKRQNSRNDEKDRMESEPTEFHKKVREGYLAQANENPESWLVLDAMDSPEKLQAKVLAELERRNWLK